MIAARICTVSLFLYCGCMEEAGLPELSVQGKVAPVFVTTAAPSDAKRGTVPLGTVPLSYSTRLLRFAGFQNVTSKHLLQHISLGLSLYTHREGGREGGRDTHIHTHIHTHRYTHTLCGT